MYGRVLTGKLLHYTSKPLDLMIRDSESQPGYNIEESSTWTFLTTVQDVWNSERSMLLRRSQTWDLQDGFTQMTLPPGHTNHDSFMAANPTLRTWRQNLHKLEVYKQQLEWNCKYNPGQQIVWVWFKIQILWILQNLQCLSYPRKVWLVFLPWRKAI
jgi:hypothetical protein